MTKAEREALETFYARLLVHEHGHFTLGRRIARHYSTRYVTDNNAGIADDYQQRAEAIDGVLATKEQSYDDVTEHGAHQSRGPAHDFPGGEDVTFRCPT
jgi:hypothetical protein